MYPDLPGDPAPASLNLAAWTNCTHALGPGDRAALWLQGCPFRCPGCLVPEWLPQRENRRIPIETLAEYLLQLPITGLSLSGGEPFLQARPLAALLRRLKAHKDLDILCFSGFWLEQLTWPAARELLAELDLLIDGPYVSERNRSVGLRGSDNQRFHFLTPRLRDCGYDFSGAPRRLELQWQADDLLVVGIPPLQGLNLLDNALAAWQTEQP